MSTVEPVPKDYPAEITGYAQPWIANPGDNVDIKVSCTEPEYSYRTIRIIQGVELPHAPRKEVQEITAIPPGCAKGRFQVARCGSYAIVEDLLIPTTTGLEVSFYFQAHLVKAGHPQSIISTLGAATKDGFAIVLNKDGLVELHVGTRFGVEVILTTFTPTYNRWVAVQLVLDKHEISLSLNPIQYVTEKTPKPFHLQKTLLKPVELRSESTLLLGASFAAISTGCLPRATNFFNGRLDRPMIKSIDNVVIAGYDFSRNISEDTIQDVSGAGYHGTLVNAPTRGIRGWNWDGSEVDFTKAKYGYGAIHFHEDDLDDAAWETDFSIQVPHDARSGIYAVEVESIKGRKTSDQIVFIVSTTEETRSKATGKVALILPTFTYLAYANDKLGDTNRASSGGTGAALCNIAPTVTVGSERNLRRLDCGLSTYDVHNDGSGNVFSTAKRPIMNLRPDFISYGLGRPRHLSAESMMMGFLEREGIPYDIITDHDLHNMGVSALLHYDVAITGGHPEYPTNEVYNAYQDYANTGGHMMYLGGNGFYWVTAFDPARPWRIEVRRGESGVRSYSLDPGEWHLSLNGILGGLWRSRGRSSHALFGVAFCSQGRPPGVPYRRTVAGSDPMFRWVFEGIQDGELIGEFGLGGGASGDEMDSFDLDQGSPLNGVVLATSTGHDDGFGIASECVKYPIIAARGTQTSDIRSDIVYYETHSGGAVFSVGSINWYTSLGWDDYQNNVARVTGNVIREFVKRAVGKIESRS